MRTPGFTAEAAFYRTSAPYRLTGRHKQVVEAVYPAQFGGSLVDITTDPIGFIRPRPCLCLWEIRIPICDSSGCHGSFTRCLYRVCI